ncbi:MAG TPA: transcriptional regulator NrdR [Dehalococcoidales bacterium]|nr:transcriptional regulator NrdR [Dehalococcoidales bacterium]
MKCPHCGYHDSKVLDSRDTSDGIRRRRQCLGCSARFTTQERLQQHTVFVIKKDKRREPFQKEKVLTGIRKACEKRPIAFHIIERLADEIEMDLITQGKEEVPSSVIGDMVMQRLKALDHIAYLRFASVYRDFTDITRLKQEVDSLADAASGLTAEPQTPSAQLPLLPEEAESALESGKRRK